MKTIMPGSTAPNGSVAEESAAELPVAEEFTTMAEQLNSQAASEGLGAWMQALGACLVYTATWYGSFCSVS